MITGSIVAVVTPMLEDGSLDLPAFGRLIDFHIGEGSAGLVVVGTTGESPTVPVEEHCELIRFAVEHAAGRIPIIAGTGANATREAVALARFAAEAGAKAHLSVVPYYNKPGQEGLYQHYRTIAEAVDLPMILYNVPGRTVADISNETVLRLAQIPNIVGLKDATGDIGRFTELIARTPQDFALYSGDDITSAAFLLLGGHGVISVTANVAPRLMSELCLAALGGEAIRTRQINNRLLALNRALFCEANPIPVKWAVARMGLINSYIRQPLSLLDEAHHARVLAAMHSAGIEV